MKIPKIKQEERVICWKPTREKKELASDFIY